MPITSMGCRGAGIQPRGECCGDRRGECLDRLGENAAEIGAHALETNHGEDTK
jgi:hypothetical protein